MTRAIVSGSLQKPVKERASKNGNPFVTFTITEKINGSTRWWGGVAFDQAVVAASKELSAGSPIAVAGEIDCELWKPADGREPRLNWKVTAEALLTASKPPKPASGREAAAKSCASPAAGGVDDDIPF
jgi:single-stranded DNA-binding protein